MPKNLRVLSKFLFLAFMLSGAGLAAQDGTGGIVWYRSNASGLTLERVPSRAAAMRNEYCLSVRNAGVEELHELLRAYYDPSFLIELRILHENGAESRRQWIFRDGEGTARLNASGGGGLFGGEDSGEKRGFVEVYNEGGFIAEERQFHGDLSESLIRFFYNRDTLVRAETRIKEAPVEEAGAEDPQSGEGERDDASPDNGADAADAAAAEQPAEDAAEQPAEQPIEEKDEYGYILMTTDFYRYTRSRSLRAVERVYHSAGNEPLRIPFPSLNPGFSRELVFVNPGIAYSSEFLQDVIVPEGGRVIYTTDSRGRVLAEQRLDEEENVIAEIRNTWSENRLLSVLYTAGDDERLTEYEYDGDGNRIVERNYNKGVLERVVRSDGERDVEELFMNGVLILRALWEEGRKISEERVRPSRKGEDPR
jgi:YD repeat-containing protein